MREEFQHKMEETTSSTQTKEREPSDSEDTEIGGESPPWIVQTHYTQHWADYVQISVEEGVLLTLGEDRAAPLVTEVHFLLSRFSMVIPPF